MGGKQDNFVRLFMAPGMQHCGGGPGPNQVNYMAIMERWREAQRRAGHDDRVSRRPTTAWTWCVRCVRIRRSRSTRAPAARTTRRTSSAKRPDRPGASALARFTEAQDQPGAGFEPALREMQAGCQGRGTGSGTCSRSCRDLAVERLADVRHSTVSTEAKAYLRDSELRSRLLAITTAVANHLSGARRSRR